MNRTDIKNREKQLLDLTKTFCAEMLDDEYSRLCEKLILKLGRKRDVPFQRGKIEIWAAAVVHAIGSINFLFDKSFEPYMSAEQISDYFGTKNSTVSNKARQIKEMFDIWHFDSDFSTQYVSDRNPMNDMVMVDGFIVPLSSIPQHYQEMVRKERAAGRDIEFTSQTES